jgi:ferredoxin--NADP+ reductase/benzoate/toluate 1,2-dioxygenase reductase subunit
MGNDAMNARRHASTVLANHTLAPGAHELVLARDGFRFRAGEELILHGDCSDDDRTYSLASGEDEPELRLLIRVIPGGRISPRLAALRPGQPVSFSGPTGSFTLRDPARPLVFIATGTGLAPLLSFIRTHPSLRPVLLHGVRHEEDLYHRAELEPRCAAYLPCVSCPAKGAARRVTDALDALPLAPDTDVYLCGGQPMIRDVRARLLRAGVPADRIRAEPYFFW